MPTNAISFIDTKLTVLATTSEAARAFVQSQAREKAPAYLSYLYYLECCMTPLLF